MPMHRKGPCVVTGRGASFSNLVLIPVLSQLWEGYNPAKMQAMHEGALLHPLCCLSQLTSEPSTIIVSDAGVPDLVCGLLLDPVPEVRCAAVYALGTTWLKVQLFSVPLIPALAASRLIYGREGGADAFAFRVGFGFVLGGSRAVRQRWRGRQRQQRQRPW